MSAIVLANPGSFAAGTSQWCWALQGDINIVVFIAPVLLLAILTFGFAFRASYLMRRTGGLIRGAVGGTFTELDMDVLFGAGRICGLAFLSLLQWGCAVAYVHTNVEALQHAQVAAAVLTALVAFYLFVIRRHRHSDGPEGATSFEVPKDHVKQTITRRGMHLIDHDATDGETKNEGHITTLKLRPMRKSVTWATPAMSESASELDQVSPEWRKTDPDPPFDSLDEQPIMDDCLLPRLAEGGPSIESTNSSPPSPPPCKSAAPSMILSETGAIQESRVDGKRLFRTRSLHESETDLLPSILSPPDGLVVPVIPPKRATMAVVLPRDQSLAPTETLSVSDSKEGPLPEYAQVRKNKNRPAESEVGVYVDPQDAIRTEVSRGSPDPSVIVFDDAYEEVRRTMGPNFGPLASQSAVPEQNAAQGTARLPHTGTADYELTFSKGQIISGIVPRREGWLEGTCNGRAGLFPSYKVSLDTEDASKGSVRLSQGFSELTELLDGGDGEDLASMPAFQRRENPTADRTSSGDWGSVYEAVLAVASPRADFQEDDQMA